MPPWIFNGGEWALDRSERMFGITLVPFAQAEGLDMMAFFVADGSTQPKVWVVDPWEGGIYEKLENFSSWVEYASNLSRGMLDRRPEYWERELWFPKSG